MSASELLLEIPLYALVIGVPLWALIAGGQAERITAVVFLVATAATNLAGHFVPYKHAGTLLLAIDGVMALCFLALALIKGHLWIALMMVAISFVFCVHAFYQMAGRALDPTFALASNLATVVLLAGLAIGVWTSRHRKDEEA